MPANHLKSTNGVYVNQPTYFRINSPAVIGEIIDGEAIIVNLDSGAYYSLRDTAGVIWSLIEKGADLGQIIQKFDAKVQSATTEIPENIRAFLAELQTENLIVPSPDPIAVIEIDATEKLLFQSPVLEKFTDMADLLLLDPIHEVDEMGGWPHPAPANKR